MMSINRSTLMLSLIFIYSSQASAYDLYKDDKSQLSFYGQIRTYFSKLEHQDLSLDADSSRAGISGSRNVFDDVNIFGKFEFNLSGNGGDLTNRQHIIGFNSPEYGVISFGRMWTVSDDMPDADYSYAYGDKVKLYKSLSYASHDSLIKYVYGDIQTRKNGEYFFAANIGLPEDDAPDSYGRKQSLYELFGGYVYNDWKIHGGYSQGKDKNRTIGTSTNNEVELKYYNASLTYFLNDGRLGATYNHRDLKKINSPMVEIKTDSIALAFEHKFNPHLTKDGWLMWYGGYAYQTADDNRNIKFEGLTNIHTGLQYYFNKWAFVYAEYGYLDGTDIGFSDVRGNVIGTKPTTYNSDSNVELGFRYYW